MLWSSGVSCMNCAVPETLHGVPTSGHLFDLFRRFSDQVPFESMAIIPSRTIIAKLCKTVLLPFIDKKSTGLVS